MGSSRISGGGSLTARRHHDAEAFPAPLGMILPKVTKA